MKTSVWEAFILSPAPVTTVVGYTEAPFAAVTFCALLCLFPGRSKIPSTRQVIIASVLFTIATSLRANGILNIGYIAFILLYRPLILPYIRTFLDPSKTTQIFRPRKSLAIKNVLLTTVLSAMILSPFLGYQYKAYRRFCTGEYVCPEWCFHTIPLVFPYIQAQYWSVNSLLHKPEMSETSRHVRLLGYWTISNVPLFIISAPVLAVSVYTIIQALRLRLPLQARTQTFIDVLSSDMLPHLLLHTLMTYIFIFQANVQIALRQCLYNPVVYWGIAGLLNSDSAKERSWGHRYRLWCIIWGVISIFLWVMFLPPA